MRSLEEQERSIPKWGGERGDYIEEKREGEKKKGQYRYVGKTTKREKKRGGKKKRGCK